MRLSRPVVSLAAAALVGALSTSVAPSAGAAPAEVVPTPYVAMGDSYSAGSGILPLDLTTSLLCARTTLNYPHVLAAATHASLKDVTCGGADTSDYATAQYPGVPPQLDALSAGTRLVTMTIGGNDGGVFSTALDTCRKAALRTWGLGSPCKDANGSRWADTVLATTYPALVQALSAVRARAPQATVAILTYPRILPETGGCFPVMLVARGDVPYLNDLQRTLNDAVSRAAAQTGVRVVDTFGPSTGHDACRPVGVRWVEPQVGGLSFVPAHPNAVGEAAMAQLTRSALGL